MAHPMNGSCAKLLRAKEHIDSLKDDLNRFLGGDPRPVRIIKEKRRDGSYVWKGIVDDPLPPRFAVIAGEVFHQLRSSLDHLVTAMVVDRGNSLSEDHGFPITARPEDFKRHLDRGALKGISRIAIDRIENVQPYLTGGLANSILWAVHRNDIEDKHRLLLVVVAAAFMGEMSIDSPGKSEGDDTPRNHNIVLSPLVSLTKDGVELATVTSADDEFKADAKFSLYVAFEKLGPLMLPAVVPGLYRALAGVIEIIRRFDDQFKDTPSWDLLSKLRS